MLPDTASYNTRLRTHAQLKPPRRLRPSPSPSPPPRSRPKHVSPQPLFPPPSAVLHPDDAANRTLLAIGRALLAVDNRAVTIKDLSHLVLDYGLFSQTPSAASQAITTFIRTHLARCHQDRTTPLLLSLPLTGTVADDRLAPALHSRSGGTSVPKDPTRALTSFRRGTTVWYLSDSAGARCPFLRAGLDVLDITNPVPKGTKRKRGLCPAPGPAMATRRRTLPGAPTPDAPTTLRVRLTVRRSPSDDAGYADPNDLDDDGPDDGPDDDPTDDPTDDPNDDAPTDHNDNTDDAPTDNTHDVLPPPPGLHPHPLLSHEMPSPSCSTPTTSLASPSADPFPPYPVNAAFSSFRTALSNPPPDHSARSSSLPFSAASPPPDSEDEDEDYHNSMVGLRRGSVPLPPKEEHHDYHDYHDYPPRLPPSVHTEPSHHAPSHLSTPLELLPGFLPYSPHSDPADHVPVKHEPVSAVLPLVAAAADDYDWRHVSDQPEAPPVHPDGAGTREDPVRIDPAMDDVELLGPESVISREWDAAWTSADPNTIDNAMHLDPRVPSPRSCTPLSDPDLVFPHPVTAPTSISSPRCTDPAPLNPDHDAPILMHPLRACDPPVVATVVQGVPVYRTLLAPTVPFLRRIDSSSVNLTPLMLILGLPLCALVSYSHPTPRIAVSCAPEPVGGTWVPLAVAQSVARHAGPSKLPPAILDVFLSADLGMWFPDALARLGQLHGSPLAPKPDTAPAVVGEVGIRVEDVFEGGECVEFRQDARLKHDVVVELQLPPPMKPCPGVVVSRASSLFFDQPNPRAAYASISMPIALNEQEESLFHSFVDILGTGVSAASSPLSSAPSSPIVKHAVTSAGAGVGTVTASANGKENTGACENAPPPPPPLAQPAVRRKREKAAVGEVPVRRSKRALAKAAPPATRSRTRHSSEGRVISSSCGS